MTLDELDRIRYSFVAAGEECRPEVATLLTVLKYYGLDEQVTVEQLTEWCHPDSEGVIGFTGLGDAAEKLGMQPDITLMDMKMLAATQLPIILFMWNEFDKPVYMVCYGLHQKRYILWDAEWGGPMQYWPDDVESFWINGIAMRLFPTHELMKKAKFHLKWWQRHPLLKRCKRQWDKIYDFFDLEVVPLFRWF